MSNPTLARLQKPFMLRLFMFKKLPAAWFMGLRLVQVSENQCVIALPYSWRSQNPFRSIYFAAQCAAGEMSTGLLALIHLDGKPAVSMLVTAVDSSYSKKAAGLTHFTCNEGQKMAEAIRRAVETGEPQTVKMESIGTLAATGEEVSRFWMTWSFRKK